MIEIEIDSEKSVGSDRTAELELGITNESDTVSDGVGTSMLDELAGVSPIDSSEVEETVTMMVSELLSSPLGVTPESPVDVLEGMISEKVVLTISVTVESGAEEDPVMEDSLMTLTSVLDGIGTEPLLKLSVVEDSIEIDGISVEEAEPHDSVDEMDMLLDSSIELGPMGMELGNTAVG
jgi:hypothetical protein